MTPPKITALILAGGRGSRMGSVDKGLQNFNNKPMIAHVLERLTPQADEIIINANRSINEYAAFGHRVIARRLACGHDACDHTTYYHSTLRFTISAAGFSHAFVAGNGKRKC
jgi:NDP-sugar pyrophosphorylase family protein